MQEALKQCSLMLTAATAATAAAEMKLLPLKVPQACLLSALACFSRQG